MATVIMWVSLVLVGIIWVIVIIAIRNSIVSGREEEEIKKQVMRR